MTCQLKALNRDLVADIMSRLDGSTLAATACTCSDLRDGAMDQRLWQQLCHSTWPSTSLPEAQHLISSSRKFYADSLPLILYDESHSHQTDQHLNPKSRISPLDFTSLVDIYYKGKCILSRVLDGIPEAVDVYYDDEAGSTPDTSIDDSKRWFYNSPFKLDLLGFNPHRSAANENEHGYNNEDDKQGGDFCDKLAVDITLSWVLLDKKKGKAVNLSSGKPLRVQKSWTCDGDYVMSFGCIVSVGERLLLTHKLAECVIQARCKTTGRGECISWKEVSLSIVDMEGSHINGKKSLMVLNEALYCLRSKRKADVEKGYRCFKEQRIEMKRRRECKESLADKLCASVEIAVFLTIFYACTLLF